MALFLLRASLLAAGALLVGGTLVLLGKGLMGSALVLGVLTVFLVREWR